MDNNQPQPQQIDIEKLKSAKEELEAICKKYSIALVPVVVHQGDRTISSVEIVQLSDAAEKAEENKPE